MASTSVQTAPYSLHETPSSFDYEHPAAMMQKIQPVKVHKIPMSPDDDNSAVMKRRIPGKENSTTDKKGQKRLDETEEQGCCATCLTIMSCMLLICTFPLSLCWSIKIVRQYERAVIFRLGKLRSGDAKGPGVFFINPYIDDYKKVDLRVVAFNVPPQEVLSKDSVTVAVDGVVYFQIRDPVMAICNIKDAAESTKMLAQSKLRMILGTKTLGEMLCGREQMAHELQEQLDDATDPWGVKVERVEIKDIRLPSQMQRAMAAEAEATREAKAKVIAAMGEQSAAKALQEASKIISESPAALQLRYLQTLNTISAERNSTIIFPFPVDFISSMLGKGCCQHHGAAISGKASGMS